MKKIYYEAGNRIRSLREEKHYTREVLAEMAEISPKFLYEIEFGMKGFSAETLYKLAEALEANTDYILFGKHEMLLNNKIHVYLNKFSEHDQKDIFEILQLIYRISDRN